jgi:predicted lipoprotein with Yx(FWY)xxD motif
MASTQHRSSAFNRTQKLRRQFQAGCMVAMFLPAMAFAANVTVNVSSNLVLVFSNARGMHTSVYDNQNGN